MADDQATGGYWDINNVWRPQTGERPFNPMDELWRYAHDPDLLPAEVARWAYDRIRVLEGAAGSRGAETATQAPLVGDVVARVIERFVEDGPLRDAARVFATEYMAGRDVAAAKAARIRAMAEEEPDPNDAPVGLDPGGDGWDPGDVR